MTRNTTLVLLATAFLAAAPFLDVAAEEDEGSFSPWVDAKGNITLPEDPRLDFAHLGSYVITDKTSDSFGFHDVYTKPESIRYYRCSPTRRLKGRATTARPANGRTAPF